MASISLSSSAQNDFASKVHIQTRVTGQPDRIKYAFVIGSEKAAHRPTVKLECVCEIKCFVRSARSLGWTVDDINDSPSWLTSAFVCSDSKVCVGLMVPAS